MYSLICNVYLRWRTREQEILDTSVGRHRKMSLSSQPEVFASRLGIGMVYLEVPLI